MLLVGQLKGCQTKSSSNNPKKQVLEGNDQNKLHNSTVRADFHYSCAALHVASNTEQ